MKYFKVIIIGFTIGWLLAYKAEAHDNTYSTYVSSVYDAIYKNY